MSSLAPASYQCWHTFGPVYALIKLSPPIALVMPVVQWCRSKLSLLGPRASVRMGVLLLCTLLASLVTALRDIVLIPIGKGGMLPGTEPLGFLELSSKYFLGEYLGILTVVPIVLALREMTREGGWQAWWRRPDARYFAMESAGVALPVLVLLIWLATKTTADYRLIARVAMFWPAMWLTVRHGWHGAAIGGTLAAISIAATTPVVSDLMTMQVQALVSAALTLLLMLGPRFAFFNQQDAQQRIEEQLDMQWVRQAVRLHEHRLEAISSDVQDLGTYMERTYQELLAEAHLHIPNFDESRYQHRHEIAQHSAHRLASSTYPLALEWGLLTALREGIVARALGEVGVGYTCTVSGGHVDELSSDGKIYVYRLICEAIVHLLHKRPCQDIRLLIRTGIHRGRVWIAVRLDSVDRPPVADPRTAAGFTARATREATHQAELIRLKRQWGTAGAPLGDMRQRARLQEGRLNVRDTAKGSRLSFLMHDLPENIPLDDLPIEGLF